MCYARNPFFAQATRSISRRDFMVAIKTKLLIESLDGDSLTAVPTLTVKGAR